MTNQSAYGLFTCNNRQILFCACEPNQIDLNTVFSGVVPTTIHVAADDFRLKSVTQNKDWASQNLLQIFKKKELISLIVFFSSRSYQKVLNTPNGQINFEANLQLWHQYAAHHHFNLIGLEDSLQEQIKLVWKKTTASQKITLLEKGFEPLVDSKSFLQSHINPEMLDNDALMSWELENGNKIPTINTILIDDRLSLILKNISSYDNDMVIIVSHHFLKMIKNRLESNSINDFKNFSQEKTKKNWLTQWIGWGIPVAIFVALLWIGIDKGLGQALSSLWFLVLTTGGLSALGSLLAFAHPLTILAAFVFAPFTALSPLIGIGHVTVIVQAWVLPPTIEEMLNIPSEYKKIGKWWKNKALRTLLCFILPSIGGAVGTYLSGFDIIKKLF